MMHFSLQDRWSPARRPAGPRAALGQRTRMCMFVAYASNMVWLRAARCVRGGVMRRAPRLHNAPSTIPELPPITFPSDCQPSPGLEPIG